VAGLLLLAAGPRGTDKGAPDMTEPPVSPRAFALPGLAPFPSELNRRLLAGIAAQGPDYRARTHHFNPDGTPTYTNRLILESSPYLLQHAHNPVNWFPWSDEAFAQARDQGKPVLLSVGYATCHWCHVMEEESFEDEEIARLINEHYVAIKVDREQRPDVDAVYMAAVNRLTGGGGWPMTVWLTAERKPFYGGTYFPPRAGVRGARVGFDRVLMALAERFHSQPDTVLDAADDLASRVQAGLAPAAADEPATAAPLHAAFTALDASFDEQHGGFGGAPKFPRSVTLEFLLRYDRRTQNRRARDMAVITLERMARGGIYDHVGGGFHRYSTDRAWLVPHFEKMLYDNALLAVAYLEAYQVTGRDDFAEVARDILRYVRRDMTAPAGTFFSATDADSEGEEGKFFVWTPAELEAALGPERAHVVGAYYGVTTAGNFDGANILHVPRGLEAAAGELGMDPADLRVHVDAARETLYRARALRVPPLTDRKILVSWNGLMISALARAAIVLRDPGQAAAAARAADSILSTMRIGERLRRSSFQGRVTGEGFLDDYAFLIAGLLDLYEATGTQRWLEDAVALQRGLDRHFWDSAGGGYFTTPDDGEILLAREKPYYDGAEPSGNSVAILNLLRLHELTTDDRYRQRAEDGLRAFGRSLSQSPMAVPKLLTALDFRLDRPKAIVVVSPHDAAGREPLLATLARTFVPNHVLSVVTAGTDQQRLASLVPLVADKIPQDGRATAYVCENRVCALPTSDPEIFARQLAAQTPLPAS
jgi:uncharacterized protein YyaL (SSP411 family)